jgi:DNA-binding IclR family transcriptional regulator
MSNACLRRLEIRQRLHPFLSPLAQAIRQPALLFVPYGWRPLLVDVVYPGNTCYDIGLEIGTLNQVHCTASGKICAAFHPRNTLDKFLSEEKFDRKASGTITKRADFKKELGKIRSSLLATCKNEMAEDLNAAAGPIFGANDDFVAIVGSWFNCKSGSSIEWNDFKRQISETAAACSSVLGCRKNAITQMPVAV